MGQPTSRRARPLTPLDLRIIARLQQDARRPFTAIGTDLGVPESTVRKRVARMESRGVLRFSAFADPLRLGFQHWTLIRLKVAARRLTQVAARVARLPETFFIGITTGDYNLFVGAIFRSNDDLMEFLKKRLFIVAGVEKTSTSSLLEMVKRRGPLIQYEERRRQRSEALDTQPGIVYEIESIDIDIIDQLQQNGRRSYSQVAATVGVSEATVQKRVARLKERGVVSFVTFADPLSLGLQHWTMFDLVVQPQQIKTAAAALAACPEIVFVGLTTGEHDVFATGIFRSSDDLLAFLTQRLGSLRGIASVSTTNIIRVVKRQLVFPVRSRLGGRDGDGRVVHAP